MSKIRDTKYNQTDLKTALEAMLQHYKLKGRYQQTRIKQLWPELMGPSIAQYTAELSISRSRVLYVRLTSAPLKQELSMGTEKICKMLNERLGEALLTKVVIK